MHKPLPFALLFAGLLAAAPVSAATFEELQAMSQDERTTYFQSLSNDDLEAQINQMRTDVGNMSSDERESLRSNVANMSDEDRTQMRETRSSFAGSNSQEFADQRAKIQGMSDEDRTAFFQDSGFTPPEGMTRPEEGTRPDFSSGDFTPPSGFGGGRPSGGGGRPF